jgi:hypothetical protein
MADGAGSERGTANGDDPAEGTPPLPSPPPAALDKPGGLCTGWGSGVRLVGQAQRGAESEANQTNCVAVRVAAETGETNQVC